jgi:hypothetical protein
MRVFTSVLTARGVRMLLAPTFGALALACDDAPSPEEPPVPANALLPGEAAPSRRAVAALPGGPSHWADGYVWVIDQGTAPSTPSPGWAFNRSGGSVTVARPAGTIGRYIVTFGGLSAWLGSRSTVHVTGDKTDVAEGVYCQPVAAYLVSDQIEVRCFRASTGAASNGSFRVLLTRNYYDLAFAHAHVPTGTNYSPDPQGSWNPAGTSSVIRHGAGQYEVVFKGLTSPLREGVGGGHVQVNAVGSGNAHCKMYNSALGSTDLSVWVRCFTPAGQPVDSRFTVLFVTPTDHLAYAIGHQPTAPSYSPLPSFSWNPAGGPITITRGSVGTYRVRWSGLDPEILGYGTIQVTAWGSDNTQCKVYTVNYNTLDFADVRCYGPSGAPADARFTILVGS